MNQKGYCFIQGKESILIMNKKIKVSIVEDSEGIRESLSLLIQSSKEFELVKSYPNAEFAMSDIGENIPDIILMDINLPSRSGVDCTVFVKEHFLKFKY